MARRLSQLRPLHLPPSSHLMVSEVPSGNVGAGSDGLRSPFQLAQIRGVRFNRAQTAPMSSVENQASGRRC